MSETSTFDPALHKETVCEHWQAVADAWSDYGPLLRRWLGPATDLLLDMTHVRRGARVLDIAAGAGDQSLQAAERVGATGHVLATDIAPRILERAANNARLAGLRLETRAMDGETVDVSEASFDAAICRLGLMYFPEPQRALAGIHRALKPGGRFGAIVYGTSAPLFVPAPGMLGLGGRGDLARAFETAGFRNIEVRAVSAPLRMPSASDYLRFERESFGALSAGIEASLAEFERDGCFEGPCELLLAVGVK